MKKYLLLLLLAFTFEALGQPALVKKHGLTLVPVQFAAPAGTKLPKVYKGKWGHLVISGSKKYGYVIDSITKDTISFYEKRPKAKANAMTMPDNGPSILPDVIEPHDSLFRESPERQPMIGAASPTVKKDAILWIADYHMVDILGRQGALDFIVAKHTMANTIATMGGLELQADIAGIILPASYANKLDSILTDSRYSTGTYPSSIINWAANKYWQSGGTCTGVMSLRSLSLGGVAFRNPTRNRGAACFFVNGSRYSIGTPKPYDFTNYCIPHEGIWGHSGGLRHAFNCTDLTDPVGKQEKKDSSYSEGPCASSIVPNPNGLVMSYQHLQQSRGGGIVARWHSQEKVQLYNNMALSPISGTWLGAPALTVDSLVNKDDAFKLTIKTPANINGTKWELFENGVLKNSGPMTQTALNQSVSMTGKTSGNYRYLAWISGNGQRHHSDSFVVTVQKATLQKCKFDSTCINGVWSYSATNPPCTGIPPQSRPCGPDIDSLQVWKTSAGWSGSFVGITGKAYTCYLVSYTGFTNENIPPIETSPPTGISVRNGWNNMKAPQRRNALSPFSPQPSRTGCWFAFKVSCASGSKFKFFYSK